MKFYRCAVCGNIIAFVEDSGVPIVCCGEEMELLVPGTVEASHEKHIPVVSQQGNRVTVRVGSVDHPMTAAHSILWIAIECKQGNQRKLLSVDGAPEASFLLTEDDAFVAAYAYCNLHGLWKA